MDLYYRVSLWYTHQIFGKKLYGTHVKINHYIEKTDWWKVTVNPEFRHATMLEF